MTDASHGWVCGRDGVILHTNDGSTWTRQTTPTTLRLYNVEAVSADEAWACGWDNVILHTTDGGNTWVRIVLYNIPYSYFYGLSFGDATHGYVAGTDGGFLYSDDGGASWRYKTVGGNTFMSCDFVNASFGMVAGESALYRTRDGGATFDPLTGSFSDLWSNVVAEKPGWKHADEIVIICGHLDDTSEDPCITPRARTTTARARWPP